MRFDYIPLIAAFKLPSHFFANVIVTDKVLQQVVPIVKPVAEHCRQFWRNKELALHLACRIDPSDPRRGPIPSFRLELLHEDLRIERRFVSQV